MSFIYIEINSKLFFVEKKNQIQRLGNIVRNQDEFSIFLFDRIDSDFS